MSRTIVFIHGAWMTPSCWDPFIAYFTERGYTCKAPAWPFHDRTVEYLRAQPDPGLSHLGLAEIADEYDRLIRRMPEPPILIGHSFGGLLTQIMLDRGLGAAGIALDPAPPRGIFAAAYPTTVRSLSRIVTTPFGWAKTFTWTLPEFAYAFAHTAPPEEQARVFEQHVVPESGRIFFENAFSLFDRRSPARVDFHNGQRAPLLIIAGADDHIVPAAMVRATFRKYTHRSSAVTHFKEFPDRTHWLIAQQGWEEIASTVEGWLQSQGIEVTPQTTP